MSGKISKRRNEKSVGDAAAIEAAGRREISPLRRLLMTMPIDALWDFVHQTKLRLSLTRSEHGNWHATVWMQGMLRYEASGNDGKATFCDALAKFLRNEQGDYHMVLAAREAEEQP